MSKSNKSPFDAEIEVNESIGNIDEMVQQSFRRRLLPVVLTKEELLGIGHEITQAQMDKERIEAEKKSAMKLFASRIEEKAKTISFQSRIYKAGKEEREVEVEVIKNYRTGTVKEIRTDTGGVVGDRPMTPSERQKELKL